MKEAKQQTTCIDCGGSQLLQAGREIPAVLPYGEVDGRDLAEVIELYRNGSPVPRWL